VNSLWQDLRYAFRFLARTPTHTAVAISALALGIGANTAIFSVVNGALLRSLPGVEYPEQLVTLERVQNGKVQYSSGYPDYLDYRDHNSSFAGLAAHCGTPLSFINAQNEILRGDLVTGNYFSVLGVKPALGRLISEEDDQQPGAHPIAVLSYRFWSRVFGGDREVIGRAIKLNGFDFTVIGVAARDFGGTETGESYDVWLPIKMQVQAMPRTLGVHWFNDRSAGWLGLFGRLKTGIQTELAQVELENIALRLEQEYPDTNSGRRVSVVSGLGLDSNQRAALSRFLGLLLLMVAMLLLIACGNVASLLLVRAISRRREIAVKLALGASRGRLIRQLLTEGFVLSLIGGGLGLLLAPWLAQVVTTIEQSAYGLRGIDVGLDSRVLGFTAFLSVATAVIFGLAPALQASSVELIAYLKDGVQGSGSRKSRLQTSLVAAQIALSLVLLIGAGLAVRTMQQALTIPRGFDSENIILMSMDLTIRGYSEAQGRAFYEELISRIDGLPGVISSSLAKTVPPNSWSDRLAVFLPGEEPPPEVLKARDDFGLRVDANRIAPDYFGTLGIPLVEGREFNDKDRVGTVPVAILNERLANHLWPGESAIGKFLFVPFWHEPRPPVQIIGVAKDTKHRSLLTEMPMLVYLPEFQAYDGRATLVVKTAVDSKTLLPAIREVFANLDKELNLFSVKTMSEQIESTLWQQRTAARLIGMFGFLALGLAAIGIYGLMANSVALRTKEIAIRMALGADVVQVQSMILRNGMVLALSGIAIGIGAAFVLTRLMSSLLYEVSATDPLTFVLSSVVLLIVALVACWIPARRATRVDPVVVLRWE